MDYFPQRVRKYEIAGCTLELTGEGAWFSVFFLIDLLHRQFIQNVQR